MAPLKGLYVWRYGKRKMIDRVEITSVGFVKCNEAERREIVRLPYINPFIVNLSANSADLNKPVAVIIQAETDKPKFMLGQSYYPV